jgi:hypothetical protein
MGKKSFALLLLLLSGMVYPLSSYDQPCTITSDCVLGLACDPQSQRCTQEATGPFGRCDNTELPYAFDNSVFTGSAVGGPGQYISEQEGGTGGALVQNTSGFYSWFYDWRVTGAIGLAIAVAIIALAAMFGHGFNLPEVKAFVDTELMQAIVSALLLVSIIAIITFTDQLSRAAVDASGLPVSCNPSEPCYVSVAKAYLANLYDVSNGYAKERFGEQLRKQSAASFGISTQLNFWLLLFAGASFRPNAGESIDASVPGTIDLLVDGRAVTVGLQWDVGGEERPYVADAPEELTLAECEAIDRAVAQAWDAHGREAAR